MVRHNNQLENNLPQLQYLLKKDPESYKDDFQTQYNSFQGMLEVFCGTPEQPNKKLEDMVMFVAQVVQCYPKELEHFPKQLIDILEKYDTVLYKDMRMQLCRALVLLRNKQLLLPNDLLELFFKLLRCDDKNLRDYLQTHIITDIKNLNAKHKNAKLNTSLQNFMFTMLKDSNTRAAKMSVDIMIELYKKNVWNDTKTVNVIATGCFSKITKVMVASLKFFLGKDEDDESDNSDSDEDIDPKEVMMANKVNKKSRKRDKNLAKVKKMAAKAYKKKSKSESFNFSALHLIHDPQGMAEKLFHQLETTTKRFEVKLITLDVISRLIGLHQLFLFNFYGYIQRFMQPHQREVTRILQFAAQASHELIPPDIIEPVLKTLANNFITERNSSDVMAIGLNAVKEICCRCPLAMSEDLLQDLAEYRNYRERAVMMASRALVHLFRNIRPQLLRRKDRGRPTEATEELTEMKYGGTEAPDYVKGADVLLTNHKEEIEINSDSGSDDEEWVDIQHSSDEEMVEEINSNSEDEEENEEGYEEEDSEDYEDEDDSGTENEEKSLTKVERKKLNAQRRIQRKVDKVELAKKATLERILTDEDFKRIDMANVKKQVFSSTKGLKRLAEQDLKERSELVKLGDIENIYKKRKHDKASRVESVRKGQEGRESFGYKDGRMNIHCSKTNREKRKTKNFQMMRHKVKAKVKKSFKDKQVALRNHLLKLKKMK